MLKAVFVADDKLYVGGSFDKVNGLDRHNVAQFDISQQPAAPQPTAWAYPNVDLGEVRCFAYSAETNTVYLGGVTWENYDAAGRFIQPVDATTGALNDWNPVTGGNVSALVVDTTGASVFAGANPNAAGITRKYVAAINTLTGQPLAWDAKFAQGSEVRELVVGGGSTLYVGGKFTNVDGQTRRHLAAFDVSNAQLLPWNPTQGVTWA